MARRVPVHRCFAKSLAIVRHNDCHGQRMGSTCVPHSKSPPPPATTQNTHGHERKRAGRTRSGPAWHINTSALSSSASTRRNRRPTRDVQGGISMPVIWTSFRNSQTRVHWGLLGFRMASRHGRGRQGRGGTVGSQGDRIMAMEKDHAAAALTRFIPWSTTVP